MKKTGITLKMKSMAVVTAIACMVSLAGDTSHTEHASAKTVKSGRLTIQKGKIYKLKHGSSNIYKSSNNKIASVTKRGVIKANKCGQCTVRVLRKNRIIKKYNIMVVTKEKSKKVSTSEGQIITPDISAGIPLQQPVLQVEKNTAVPTQATAPTLAQTPEAPTGTSTPDMGGQKETPAPTRAPKEKIDYREIDGKYVENKMIIKFKNKKSEEEVRDIFEGEVIESVEDIYKSVYDAVKEEDSTDSSNLYQIYEQIGLTYIIKFAGKTNEELIDLINVMNDREDVEYAEPDYISTIE